MGFVQSLLILLLVLPAAAAIVVACLGQGRALLVRQISLGATVASAIVALFVAGEFLGNRGDMKDATTYRPEFVPGSTAQAKHETTWSLIDFDSGRDVTVRNAPKLGAVQFF